MLMLSVACGTLASPEPTNSSKISSITLIPTATPAPAATQTPVPLPTLTASPTPVLAPPQISVGLVAEVTRVVDGDTIDVVFPDGSIERVRFLGIDTPETSSTNKAYEYGNIADTACLDHWGSLATEFAVQELRGQTINLIIDPLAGERGFYGRLLAYVLVRGQDFNATLIELGYARVYTEGNSTREQDYLKLEGQAQEEGIGLWECEENISLPTSTLTATFIPTNTPTPTSTPKPIPTPTRPPFSALSVDASVKFATLGGGTQTLYATITQEGRPVEGAEVSIRVRYKTVTRAFKAASPTGTDGMTQLQWSVGRPRGGYTVRIIVTARYQDQTATTTTGFYAP